VARGGDTHIGARFGDVLRSSLFAASFASSLRAIAAYVAAARRARGVKIFFRASSAIPYRVPVVIASVKDGEINSGARAGFTGARV
jgi:hypothetical protein